MEKVTLSEDHSYWGGGPWTPSEGPPFSGEIHAGWAGWQSVTEAGLNQTSAPEAGASQSAPLVHTQSTCRRLTECSEVRGPLAARSSSVGLALTLWLPW